MSTFYSDMAVLLDEKFRAVENLPLKKAMRKFKTAAWNFVQLLYGIQHDDYNYEEIDETLSNDVQEWIVGCCNNRASTSSSSSSSRTSGTFTPPSSLEYDVSTCSIILMEAKLQCELLYILKAVMKHMS